MLYKLSGQSEHEGKSKQSLDHFFKHSPDEHLDVRSIHVTAEVTIETQSIFPKGSATRRWQSARKSPVSTGTYLDAQNQAYNSAHRPTSVEGGVVHMINRMETQTVRTVQETPSSNRPRGGRIGVNTGKERVGGGGQKGGFLGSWELGCDEVLRGTRMRKINAYY